MNIEPLESRIAPAAVFVNATTATYTDVDGDRVTVTFSRPVLPDTGLATILITAPAGVGEQLQQINLLSGFLASAPAGMNITITAQAQDLTPGNGDATKSGDNQANLGSLKATNIDLGNVTIKGDLASIFCGDGNAANGLALKTLNVRSMGRLGLDSSGGLSGLESDILGRVNALVVGGDMKEVHFHTTGGIGAVTIKGSLIGGAAADSGRIFSNGDIGPVSIGGNIEGGGGQDSGAVESLSGMIKSLSVGGSVRGGAGQKSGYVEANMGLGAVVIGHNLEGGTSPLTGIVKSGAGIGSVTLGGSLIATGSLVSGNIQAASSIGPVKIGGDIRAAGFSGQVTAGTTLGPVTVGGSVIGNGTLAAVIESGGAMEAVKIGGDLRGGGSDSGTIDSGGTLASVMIGGSVVGGFDNRSGRIHSAGAMGPVNVGGSVIGGTGNDSGRIDSGGNLSSVKIVGDLMGGSGMNSGRIQMEQALGAAKIGAITIGGSVVGGSGPESGNIFSAGSINAIKIGRDLAGGFGQGSGAIFADQAIKSLVIGGSVRGASASFTGKITADISLDSVTIRGDLRGGDASSNSVTDSGTIFSDRIGSLTIGGSIIAGSVRGAGSLDHSGSVTARFDIGTLTVKGSLVGNPTQLVKIYADGQQTPTTTSDVAIKSLTIGGRVEHTWIFGGVDRTGVGFNGNAQIGAVSVGGDWIASSLGSGVTSVDGIIGNGNDAVLAGFANDNGAGSNTIVAKIASITIGDQVLGRAGTTETFGFLAEQIGSFKSNGVALALTAGAKNDTFGGLGNFRAHPVGPSLSPSTFFKLSNFAVHVFEV